jgi:integrase
LESHTNLAKGTPLGKIGQAELDGAAAAILPNALPQTRNRSVYTPSLAIMRHAGVVKAIKRPKWTGGKRVDWLRPAEAFKRLEAASEVDERLGALMTFLLYAGPRLSEALRLEWVDIDLTRSTTLLRQIKERRADRGSPSAGPPSPRLPPRQDQASRLRPEQVRPSLCAARSGREAIRRDLAAALGLPHVETLSRHVEAPVRRRRHKRAGRVRPLDVA